MWRSVPDAAAAEAGPSRRFGLDADAGLPGAEDSRPRVTSSRSPLQPVGGRDTVEETPRRAAPLMLVPATSRPRQSTIDGRPRQSTLSFCFLSKKKKKKNQN